MVAVTSTSYMYAEKAPDPTGATTGTAADVAAATPGKPTLDEVAAQAGHNKVAINFMWVLITGFIVMFMQFGFAAVEGGFTRAKNASHTFAMNFLIYPLGMIGFFICGFAFMFGGGRNTRDTRWLRRTQSGICSHNCRSQLWSNRIERILPEWRSL